MPCNLSSQTLPEKPSRRPNSSGRWSFHERPCVTPVCAIWKKTWETSRLFYTGGTNQEIRVQGLLECKQSPRNYGFERRRVKHSPARDVRRRHSETRATRRRTNKPPGRYPTTGYVSDRTRACRYSLRTPARRPLSRLISNREESNLRKPEVTDVATRRASPETRRFIASRVVSGRETGRDDAKRREVPDFAELAACTGAHPPCAPPFTPRPSSQIC